jgi:uroporphyrinogen III methyltransferase/synthase
MGTLDGRRLVVTRRPGQSSRLVALLEERGASVLEVPAIEVVAAPDTGPLDEALAGLSRYDWVVFTSANAVSAVMGRLVVLGLEPRLGGRGAAGGRPRVASVGPATTTALRATFPEDPVALEPTGEFRAAGLVEAFRRTGVGGARILVPASTRARDELPAGLRDLGARVDVVAAYATVDAPGLEEAVKGCLEGGFDLALFASPSAVEGFAHAAGDRAHGVPAAVIGPTTEAAARAAGMDVRAVARPSTIEGLVAAAEAVLGGSERSERPLR